MTDAVIALLERLINLVDSLPARLALELRAPTKPLGARDERAVQELLPEIFDLTGGAIFSVSDLLDAAASDRPALLDAINAAVGERSGHDQARALGRLLRRAQGHTVRGLVVSAEVEARDGWLRRVQRVSR